MEDTLTGLAGLNVQLSVGLASSTAQEPVPTRSRSTTALPVPLLVHLTIPKFAILVYRAKVNWPYIPRFINLAGS
ncbi:hypothetical protein DPMN_076747 [Dreissena polymorpha]|uniref:Uncharacterized protein n=1 Tax=Dreissena polymorpha TaxID=45954 RepID=A0A9D3YJ79_DREPO|nr:hypothetical protein DPMN_075144 [Dreissena polymorpha]KAH3701752.1 hypothetical protein DPMN_076747 [Dreissena polymorpha]